MAGLRDAERDREHWWVYALASAMLLATLALVLRFHFSWDELRAEVPAQQALGTVLDHRARNARERKRLRGALTGFRIAAFAFFATVLVVQGLQEGSRPMRYFTLWNFLLQGVYFGVAGGLGAAHLAGAAMDSAGARAALKAAGLLHAVCVTMAVMVSVVFWCLLFPLAVTRGDQSNFENATDFYAISEHAINTCVLLIEFGFGRGVLRRSHLLPVQVWATTYLFFAWAMHLCCLHNWWPYFFMRLNTAALLWYEVILLTHFVAFRVMFAASRFKQRKLQECDEGAASELSSTSVGETPLLRS